MDVRMAVICWMFFIGEKPSLNRKSKSLNRQIFTTNLKISQSCLANFVAKNSIETAEGHFLEALIFIRICYTIWEWMKYLTISPGSDLSHFNECLGVWRFVLAIFRSQVHGVPMFAIPSHPDFCQKCCFYDTFTAPEAPWFLGPKIFPRFFRLKRRFTRPSWETRNAVSEVPQNVFENDEAYPLRTNISHLGKRNIFTSGLVTGYVSSQESMKLCSSKFSFKVVPQITLEARCHTGNFFMEVCCLQWPW